MLDMICISICFNHRIISKCIQWFKCLQHQFRCWRVFIFQLNFVYCGTCISGMRAQINLFMSIVPCNLNHKLTDKHLARWFIGLVGSLGTITNCRKRSHKKQITFHSHRNVIIRCGSICARIVSLTTCHDTLKYKLACGSCGITYRTVN